MARNLSIDLVKIIAMLMVIHIRVTGVVSESLLSLCNDAYSGIAIPLFFMVSGYLLSAKNLTPKYSVKKIKGILRFVGITVTTIIAYRTFFAVAGGKSTLGGCRLIFLGFGKAV